MSTSEKQTPTPPSARWLSPRRHSTNASDIGQLVDEQLVHFGIDQSSEFGQGLARIARRLYECHGDIERLWQITLESISSLDPRRPHRLLQRQEIPLLSVRQAARHAAIAFAAELSEPRLRIDHAICEGALRGLRQCDGYFRGQPGDHANRHLYLCLRRMIADAFQGKELLLEIYSRLLNPTSVALANYIVDIEAGPYSREYFAWNFNSGMAAIDAALGHLLGAGDVLITSRNIYGGAHQLIHDWYAKPGNLEIAVDTFDGFTADDFLTCWKRVEAQYGDRLRAGRKAYLYLESPCNPHGYVLDVPAICRAAHERGLRVMLDATIGTPFLIRPLERDDPVERPDFVIHSYTKDLSGSGTVVAGVVIGRNEDMFIPKGESAGGASWRDTLFWNVYYVKGAFLNADAAFDVMQGVRTLENRMLAKCINTSILARFLDAHPGVKVHSHALVRDENSRFREKLLFLGLPAPLFTIDFEEVRIPQRAFQRFFDNLSPTFGHMISLGQSNTIISCPALTTHSELRKRRCAAAALRRRPSALPWETKTRATCSSTWSRRLALRSIRKCLTSRSSFPRLRRWMR